jgi:hypothetical protein
MWLPTQNTNVEPSIVHYDVGPSDFCSGIRCVGYWEVVAMGLVFNPPLGSSWCCLCGLCKVWWKCSNIYILYANFFVDAKFGIVAKFSIINSLFFEKNQNMWTKTKILKNH